MVDTAIKTVYVLQRLNWSRTDPYDKDAFQGLRRLPGATRLASYSDPDEAERERKAREEKVRRLVNPFRCGGPALHYQTRFDEGPLHDWLFDLGIEPPLPDETGRRDWIGWWDREHKKWNEYQWARVWEVLDGARFFEVVERPARPVVYVVVEVGWVYNDEGYDADPEGGKPVKAFRSREKAERHRQELEQQQRERLDEDEASWYEITERIRCRNPFTAERLEQVTVLDVEQAFYEVVELELEQ